MPRRSSGGRPAPRPVRSVPPRSAPPPATAPAHAPPPAQVQPGGGSLLGGLGATIAQGMAFGTGSAIAHRAVDGIMGPRTVTHEHVTTEAPAASVAGAPNLTTVSGADACANQTKAFQDCVNAYGSDIGKCQFYIDMLNECRRGPPSVAL
ncbi:hypothetical protein KP509_01G029900 [Ceratopteris richardii]|uniref:CHCH domain-containing protein n=1 Tax=Ceratopteris richardii TaxID=49495 RepID=A0A8T2VJY9_CERRI|nr:hypothetical protein KP509_01G029900 [Ceratopteris richardii]